MEIQLVITTLINIGKRIFSSVMMLCPSDLTDVTAQYVKYPGRNKVRGIVRMDKSTETKSISSTN
jgi:hypothetical protein